MPKHISMGAHTAWCPRRQRQLISYAKTAFKGVGREGGHTETNDSFIANDSVLFLGEGVGVGGCRGW